MDQRPCIKDLRKCIPNIAVHWYELGIQLGLDTHELDSIDQSCRMLPTEESCRAMLNLWKKRNKFVAADQLLEAIRDRGNNYYAARLCTGVNTYHAMQIGICLFCVLYVYMCAGVLI